MNQHLRNSVWIALALTLVIGTAEAGQKKKKQGMVKEMDEKVSTQGYGLAGCGLGSILFGQQEGIIQIFAGTTNGTSGNQTFAITSGTSNCDAGSGTMEANLHGFVEANQIALMSDSARGNGETIATVAKILNCQDSQELGRSLQKNYGTIFSGSSSSEISSRVMGTAQSTNCGKSSS